MNEEWKDIYYIDIRNGEKIDYTGYYQVSNLGRIKSLPRLDTNNHIQGGKILKPKIHKQSGGYRYIILSKNNNQRTFKIHRLVAEMFIDNPDKKEYVDHIIPISNGGDDSINNLKWCTMKENNNNKLTKENHFTPDNSGSNNGRKRKIAKLKNDKIIKIYDFIKQVEIDGMNKNNVGNCLRGKYKKAYGYKWKYIECCSEEQINEYYKKGGVNIRNINVEKKLKSGK